MASNSKTNATHLNGSKPKPSDDIRWVRGVNVGGWLTLERYEYEKDLL